MPKAYGSYEALLDDPDIQVVHNATPNYLHFPVNAAAIAKGKHVVSDKPLAMTAAEAKSLLDAATKAGIVHAVTFNYRGNPLVQQARALDRARRHRHAALRARPLPAGLAAARTPTTRGGSSPTRAAPRRRSATSARTGATWRSTSAACSIVEVLADITTVIPKRKKPRGSREAFAAAGGNDEFELVDIKVEDLASVLVRFDNGAKGAFSVGQVCAGHKNDLRARGLRLEGVAARGSRKTRTSCGSATATRPTRSCRRIRRCSTPRSRGYAHLPGGHQEAWADAFCNLMRDIYGFIAAGKKPGDAHPPAFATFEDGYRANVRRRGDAREREEGQRVDQGDLLMSMQAVSNRSS